MRFARIALRSLVLLLGVVALLAAFVLVSSSRKLAEIRPVPDEPELALPTDSASIERGRHLATAVSACVLCHADDLGGLIAMDMGPVGRMVGTNLTRGRGGVGGRSTRDLERAIRHGVRSDGTSLLVMPSEAFTHLSDRDLASLLAFLRSLEPVDRALPPSELHPLGRALLAFGQLHLQVAEKVVGAHSPFVEPAVSVEYGAYLADVAGCTGCHGRDLAGKKVPGPPGAPAPPDLTPRALGAWSEADFVKVMRTGLRPDGRALHDFMPWRVFARMTDDELRALWLELRAVRSPPPRAASD